MFAACVFRGDNAFLENVQTPTSLLRRLPTALLQRISENQIVVPNKGTAAMENCGIMTLGYDYLSPLITSEMRGDVGSYHSNAIIVHELLLQWQGNLVTCAW